MAKTLTNTFSIVLADDSYTGTYGQGSAILQGSLVEDVGPNEDVIAVIRGDSVELALGASAVDFFPTYPLPSGAMITMEVLVEYGATDVGATKRLLTWLVDVSGVTTCEARHSFSFGTSCTVSRGSVGGALTCYVTPVWIIRKS